MEPRHKDPKVSSLSVEDLLAGSSAIHEVEVPEALLGPIGVRAAGRRVVRIRPLSVGALSLISRASRDDAGLVPLLMIKESLCEPMVSFEQVRQMNVGLVHFLIGRINEASGLTVDGDPYEEAAASPLGKTHLLLAKHFGWTPEQVGQLTPAQVMVYLAGIERLLALDEARRQPEA